MLYLHEEEGRAKVWLGLGLGLAVIVVLIPCITCLALVVFGPQIGNIFSRVNSGLEAGG
jgi:hypothetical protein